MSGGFSMSQSENIQHPTVMDSDAQQVGDLYGKALLAAAGSEVDEILVQLTAIVDQCLAEQPGLESLLSSPRVSQLDKENLIDRIFGGKIQVKLLNFLKVLCRRGRIGSLRVIQVSAVRMRDEQLGKVRVSVTSAFELSEDQLQLIATATGNSLGKQVVIEQSVDPELMGGIMIRVGDQVYDGTVLGKLAAIRSAVAGGIQKAVRDRQGSLLTT